MWVRDGTLAGPDGTEIDLRDTRSRYMTWVTVKATDKEAEKLAARLLTLLNAKTQ